MPGAGTLTLAKMTAFQEKYPVNLLKPSFKQGQDLRHPFTREWEIRAGLGLMGMSVLG